MKVCVIQPPYSTEYSDSANRFQWELDALNRCDDSLDMIVLPEYANVPAKVRTKAQLEESRSAFTAPLLAACAETAKRCNAVVFVGCAWDSPEGLRNTTLAFNRQGNLAGQYYKQHLVPMEMGLYGLDKDYTFQAEAPTILEIDGVRYGFLICYDAYFYESFANIARFDPDVIVACSHQRSDSHDALETLHKFCAYNTNAYVVRSSVSMGLDSPTGGCSMIVAPDGSVLANMKSAVGEATAEFDPKQRYLKPAGYGNAPDCHHHYVEAGRRPWKYRNGGAAMVPYDHWMGYPRVCAHRGFNTIAPENSLPAYGAAVAMGAEEIEFDLWAAKDGTIVSIHDPVLDRVSNGTGFVWEHTYEQLLQYDFGSVYSPEYAGLKIPTFEDILKKFAGQTIMNIHIKDRGAEHPIADEVILEMARLIKQYDCEKHVYFMSGHVPLLRQLQRLAPQIPRCAGAGKEPEDLVEKALATGCTKIQLYIPHFKFYGEDYVAQICRKAHEKGILCNLFYTDDPEKVAQYLDWGVDTILTNDYQRVATAVEAWKAKK
ncbi:MAG: hypothetical protein IJO31_08735 [Oscillospiraceae bacterium]|nr:hypothetical protein [Oscillospiraceae bacterium]